MKFVDSVGVELNEQDEVIVPYGNLLASGKLVKLGSGLGLDSTPQGQPTAVIAVLINPLVTPAGVVLNVLAAKSLHREQSVTI